MMAPSLRGFAEIVFGRGAIAAFDFPSRLIQLAEKLPPGHPETAESLLEKHTLLPLYLPFLPEDRSARCIRAALGDGGKSLPFLTGNMASILKTPEFLRICPRCWGEDKSQFGEPYWHRSHQIAGITICHKHGVNLVESCVARGGRKNRQNFECPSAPMGEALGKERNEKAWGLARDCHRILTDIRCRPGLDTLKTAYKEALAEIRLATPGGRIHIPQLTEQFLAFWNPGFLREIGCEITKERNWLVNMLRGRERSPHPVQHLLFIHFVGHTAKSFFEIAVMEKPPVEEPAEQRPEVPLEPLWNDASLSLRHISRQLGVDPMTVKRRAARNGLPFPRNSKRPTRKIPSLGKPRRRTRINLHRKHWERTLSKNPRNLRAAAPVSYSYLYRYDREWLARHSRREVFGGHEGANCNSVSGCSVSGQHHCRKKRSSASSRERKGSLTSPTAKSGACSG